MDLSHYNKKILPDVQNLPKSSNPGRLFGHIFWILPEGESYFTVFAFYVQLKDHKNRWMNPSF